LLPRGRRTSPVGGPIRGVGAGAEEAGEAAARLALVKRARPPYGPRRCGRPRQAAARSCRRVERFSGGRDDGGRTRDHPRPRKHRPAARLALLCRPARETFGPHPRPAKTRAQATENAPKAIDTIRLKKRLSFPARAFRA